MPTCLQQTSAYSTSMDIRIRDLILSHSNVSRHLELTCALIGCSERVRFSTGGVQWQVLTRNMSSSWDQTQHYVSPPLNIGQFPLTSPGPNYDTLLPKIRRDRTMKMTYYLYGRISQTLSAFPRTGEHGTKIPTNQSFMAGNVTWTTKALGTPVTRLYSPATTILPQQKTTLLIITSDSEGDHGGVTRNKLTHQFPKPKPNESSSGIWTAAYGWVATLVLKMTLISWT